MNNHEYTQFLLRNLGLCLILIFCQKPLPAFFVIAGNIISVVIGQFLGDLIQTENIKKITDTMNPQQIYELHNHPGVSLWLLVIVLFLILGLITDLFFNKFHKKRVSRDHQIWWSRDTLFLWNLLKNKSVIKPSIRKSTMTSSHRDTPGWLCSS